MEKGYTGHEFSSEEKLESFTHEDMSVVKKIKKEKDIPVEERISELKNELKANVQEEEVAEPVQDGTVETTEDIENHYKKLKGKFFDLFTKSSNVFNHLTHTIVKFSEDQGFKEDFLSDYGVSEILGVQDFEAITTEKGNSVKIVTIDVNKWPNIVNSGLARKNSNIIFVQSGFSPRAAKMLREHEIFHIDNPQASELETIWRSNITVDPIGSLAVVFQQPFQGLKTLFHRLFK